MKLKIKKPIFIFALVIAVILPYGFASASETNGTIDSTYKYAWSENIGWVNFVCDNCNVSITDSAITGYAWSANYGWINLDPSGSGVSNDGAGTLSGSAWGENAGWIDFSGITIDSSGYFNGYASGTITGQISFNCSNTSSCGSSDFKVRTDWRPQSARAACNNSLDDDSDGLIDYPNDLGCSSSGDNDEVNSSGGGLASPSSIGNGQSISLVDIGQAKSIPQVDVQGNNILMHINSEVVFSLSGDTKEYSAVVSDLDMTSEQITLEFDGRLKNFKFNVGQEKEIDLDGDGINDIKIKYNELLINRIDLTFSKLKAISAKQPITTDIQLVKEPGKSTVYKIEDGKKRPIFNGQVFEDLGFSWGDVVEVGDLSSYEVGDILTKTVETSHQIFKDGDLVAEQGSPKVYLIENNKKRWIVDEQAFVSNHFLWDDIIKVADLSDMVAGEVISGQQEEDLNRQNHTAVAVVFIRDLRQGDRGADVKALQQFLNQLDEHKLVDQGPGSTGQETEFFGQLTYEALKKCQESHKEKILAPLGFSSSTGSFGLSTRNFINSFR